MKPAPTVRHVKLSAPGLVVRAGLLVLVALVAAGSSAATPPARAQADPAGFTRIERRATLGDSPVATAVAMDEGRMLAGFGSRLVIADPSSPGPAAVLGSVALSGDIVELATGGGMAYVLTRAALFVVDLEDVSRPQVRSVVDTGPELTTLGDVVVHAGQVYVGNRNGLRILEASATGQPRLLAQVLGIRDVTGVDVASGIVAIATAGEENSALVLVAVGDPAHPRELGRLSAPEVPEGQRPLRLMDIAWTGRHVLAVSGSPDRCALMTADVSKPGRPSWVGVMPSPMCSSRPHLRISGTDAYVSGHGLVRYDIRDPLHPRDPVWADYHDTFATNLAVAGPSILIAGDRGVELVEAPDSLGGGLRIVGDVPLAIGNLSHVATSRRRAFASDGLAGRVDVVDLSDPTDPRLASSLALEGHQQVRAIVADGERAYVSAEPNTLFVIDATDPDAATILGQLADVDLRDMVLSGRHLYGASNAEGLVGLDVTDPTAPRRLSRLAMSDASPGARAIRLAPGQRAVILGMDDSLTIVDLADPRAPRRLGRLAGFASETRGLTLVRDSAVVLFAADPFTVGLVTVDLSEPSAPAVRSRRALPWWLTDPRDISAVGDVVLVAGQSFEGEGGLLGLDASDPNALRVLSGLPGFSHRMAVNEDLGLVAVLTATELDGEETLALVAVEPPVDFRRRAWLSRPGGGADVALGTDLALVAAGWQGLQVVDIRDPIRPRLRATVDVGASADRVALVDGPRAVLALSYLYTGEATFSASGLVAADLHDPSAPRLGSILRLGERNVVGLAVHGEQVVAVVQNSSSGIPELQVLDLPVVGPAHVVGSLSLGTVRWVSDLAVLGDTAYLLDFNGTLLSVDLTDPATPSLRSALALIESMPIGQPLDLAVRDGLALVLGQTKSGSALAVVDLRDPVHPRVRGSLALDGMVETAHVDLSGPWAWVSEARGLLRLVDLADPDRPRLAAQYLAPEDSLRGYSAEDPGWFTGGLAAAGERAFVTAENAVLWTFELSHGPCRGTCAFLPSLSRP